MFALWPAGGGVTALGAGNGAETRPRTGHLDPSLFQELSSGIALVRTFNCSGVATGEGTGFLVGASVLMTARHVVRGACRVKVQFDGSWINAASWVSWYYGNRHDINSADVATIKLSAAASGHIFPIRTWSPGVGANVTALGHPLGNGISISQGVVLRKGSLDGVPTFALRLLGAEGGSGSPLVDNAGNVIGILQQGLGATDALGQHTSGLILGIDLPSWWPNAKRNLCKAYPYGGLPNCPTKSASPPPPPTTPPPPNYQVSSCWSQFTGASWDNVASTKRTISFAAADLLAQGPSNFWSVVELAAPPLVSFSGATVALVQPNGATFATLALHDWSTSIRQWSTSFSWTFGADGLLFFQHPERTGTGQWTMRWTFPDGESCASTFSVG